MPLAQWLLNESRRRGVRGATLNGSIEGVGRDGKTHTINMFDLSEHPVQVALVVNEEEARGFFAHLAQQKVQIFYMKTPVEFGTSGDAAGGAASPVSVIRCGA